MTQARAAFTTGELAARFNVPIHRIRYAILARGIEPAERVAHYKLYDETAAELIRRALRTDTHRPEIMATR